MVRPDELKNIVKPELDFTDPRSTEGMILVFKAAEQLIQKASGSIAALLKLEAKVSANSQVYSSLEHLAVKAAISRLRILSLNKPAHIQIVVPLYHEATRMAPRASSKQNILSNSLRINENGEDSLIRKYVELDWLTRGSQLTFKLHFVDDMCDQNSGQIAQELIRQNNLPNCEVHFLGQEIKTAIPGTLKYQAIESVVHERASVKGGALCLGFAEALTDIYTRSLSEDSIVSYVDADNSYSLTQIGIPLWEILQNNEILAITASRQHPLAFLERTKDSKRSPGLIRLKQVIGYLRREIIGTKVPADTQSGFKFFKPDVLENLLKQGNKSTSFSFDTQLLARLARNHPDQEAIHTFGAVCLDSDELSTANNGVTYFYLLRILKELAKESDLINHKGELWLLDFLTSSVQNYSTIQFMLDSANDPGIWFTIGSQNYILLNQLRQEIRTDRDTTAVGEYFTPGLFEKLVRVVRSYLKSKEV